MRGKVIFPVLVAACAACVGPLEGDRSSELGDEVDKEGSLCTTTQLRLRTGPGTDHDILTTMPAGAEVERVDEAEVAAGGCRWWRVSSGGESGWAAGACGAETYLGPCGSSEFEPTPAIPAGPSEVGQFLGFHDCSSIGSGSPQTYADGRCDPEFHEAFNEIGSGWVTLLGHVGGSFLEGYAPSLDAGALLNFHHVPAGVQILLRLDWSAAHAFPPLREEGDADRYGDAVVEWLRHAPGSERVQYVVLGNEMDQTMAEYPEWSPGWNMGRSDEELGVVRCGIIGEPRPIQYVTPERYAELFVSVVAALRRAGMQDKRLVVAPPMPMRFAQWSAEHRDSDPICRDYSMGDYLAAIDREARARGVSSPVGGISLHLQGASYPGAEETRAWIDASLDDAHTLTRAIAADAGGVRIGVAGSFSGFGGVPVFIKEIHPRWPFWGASPEEVRSWVYGTALGVAEFNRTGRHGHRVHAVTFYRWMPGSDVPFDQNRGAAIEGIRDAVRDLGL